MNVLAFSALAFLPLSMALAQERPAAERIEIKEDAKNYVLTVAVSRLVMTIPKGDLKVDESPRSGSASNPRYFQLDNKGQPRLIVSGWFESAERFKDVKQLWADDTSAWKKQGLPEAQDVSFETIGSWKAVVYNLKVPAVRNSHIRAHWVQAGTWIDAHLSMTGDLPETELRQKLRSVLASFLVSESQTLPGTEPVSAERLKGRAFLGPDSSLSVEAPADDWQWIQFIQAEKAASAIHPEVSSKMYLLYQATTRTAFVFSVLSDGREAAPNEQFMRGLQSGIERTSPKTGWVIQGFSFEPSDIPVKGSSYRYHSKAVRSDGTVKYRFGYIGGVTKKYQFEYADLTEKESPTFTAVVSSFREVDAAK